MFNKLFLPHSTLISGNLSLPIRMQHPVPFWGDCMPNLRTRTIDEQQLCGKSSLCALYNHKINTHHRTRSRHLHLHLQKPHSTQHELKRRSKKFSQNSHLSSPLPKNSKLRKNSYNSLNPQRNSGIKRKQMSWRSQLPLPFFHPSAIFGDPLASTPKTGRLGSKRSNPQPILGFIPSSLKSQLIPPLILFLTTSLAILKPLKREEV